MPTKLNNRPQKIPVHYGGSSGYNWDPFDPFSNPFDKKSSIEKRSNNKRKYKKRKPKYE